MRFTARTPSLSWDGLLLVGNKKTPICSIIDPKVINNYFCEINTDPNYSAPIPVVIPEDARIPEISISLVTQFLSRLKRTAYSPDYVPFWIWRDYAYDLAPILMHVLFNSSLCSHTVPSIWKLADITPPPKEIPFSTNNQLRPISLTCIIMRLFERIVYQREMSNICNESIDSDQFAYRKGHNTTMALIKNQHYWLKWLDRDYDFVRVFSFDFTKAFDSVPHDILIPKIARLYINPYIFNWLTSFLESRQQRVRVDVLQLVLKTSTMDCCRELYLGWCFSL